MIVMTDQAREKVEKMVALKIVMTSQMKVALVAGDEILGQGGWWQWRRWWQTGRRRQRHSTKRRHDGQRSGSYDCNGEENADDGLEWGRGRW